MKCYRCHKDLGHADDSNADYVISPDAIVNEPIEVYRAEVDNAATKVRKEKTKADHKKETKALKDAFIKNNPTKPVPDMPDEPTPEKMFNDIENDGIKFDVVEIDTPLDAWRLYPSNEIFGVTTDIEVRPVQKTALVCPECFNKDTDYIIWGFHKKDDGVHLARDLE